MEVAAFDLHAGYVLMMLLAFALTLTHPLTKHFPDANSRRRYYTLQAITAVCAVLGAKFSVLMGDALWPLRQFEDWSALLGSGRSIAGALLFGFLGAEIAKPLLKYDIPPNDRFAVILPFSIGVGRIGCLLAGCCLGTPFDGPVAISYADDIPRHPIPVYEMVFHLGTGYLLLAMWRRQMLFGRLFAFYLVAYGAFRFSTEYVRETEKAFAGWSAYQWLAIAMIVAGLVALIARSVHQPNSWQQWRAHASKA